MVWGLAARLSSALLQVVVLVLLARGLAPHSFALVSSVSVVLQIVVAVNGFGLLRQLQFRRSRDPGDPSLGTLFALRLRFSYASAVGWVVGCLLLHGVFGHGFFLALLPAAVWLLVEQTTQVWNAVSIADGRSQHLLGSYLTRRVPVVVFLAVALASGLPIVWSWTLGLAAGSLLSYWQGYRTQEAWARIVWPRRSDIHEKMPFELGYWWGLVGMQVRDLDVAAMSVVSTAAAGIYAFPARLVAPMNLVTVSTASSAFPRVARAGGLTRRQLRLGVTLGLAPVIVIAATTALMAPLLPLLLGHAYAESVDVLRITCLTAVLSGAATMVGSLLQAHSTDAARAVGYLALGFAVLQIVAAGLGAVLAGATTAAMLVALVNAALAATIYVLARRTTAA